MPNHYESNPFDEQNTADAAGQGTKKNKKKKKKRYNPWGEDATANPENMIPGKP